MNHQSRTLPKPFLRRAGRGGEGAFACGSFMHRPRSPSDIGARFHPLFHVHGDLRVHIVNIGVSGEALRLHQSLVFPTLFGVQIFLVSFIRLSNYPLSLFRLSTFLFQFYSTFKFPFSMLFDFQISAFDDPDWPFTDTTYIMTSATEVEVASWFPEHLKPDDFWEGFVDQAYEPYDVPDGSRPVAAWWD